MDLILTDFLHPSVYCNEVLFVCFVYLLIDLPLMWVELVTHILGYKINS